MVKNFAAWYPVDEDKEESRFSEYYSFLGKKGVAFPKSDSYFKQADEDKFKKNYKVWLENEAKNSQEQKPGKPQVSDSKVAQPSVPKEQSKVNETAPKQ